MSNKKLSVVNKLNGEKNWKVLEDNPWPDNYIAIISPDLNDDVTIKYSEYHSKEDALARGEKLKKIYDVKRIKIFYKDGTKIINGKQAR